MPNPPVPLENILFFGLSLLSTALVIEVLFGASYTPLRLLALTVGLAGLAVSIIVWRLS